MGILILSLTSPSSRLKVELIVYTGCHDWYAWKH